MAASASASKVEARRIGWDKGISELMFSRDWGRSIGFARASEGGVLGAQRARCFRVCHNPQGIKRFAEYWHGDGCLGDDGGRRGRDRSDRQHTHQWSLL